MPKRPNRQQWLFFLASSIVVPAWFRTGLSPSLSFGLNLPPGVLISPQNTPHCQKYLFNTTADFFKWLVFSLFFVFLLPLPSPSCAPPSFLPSLLLFFLFFCPSLRGRLLDGFRSAHPKSGCGRADMFGQRKKTKNLLPSRSMLFFSWSTPCLSTALSPPRQHPPFTDVWEPSHLVPERSQGQPGHPPGKTKIAAARHGLLHGETLLFFSKYRYIYIYIYMILLIRKLNRIFFYEWMNWLVAACSGLLHYYTRTTQLYLGFYSSDVPSPTDKKRPVESRMSFLSTSFCVCCAFIMCS